VPVVPGGQETGMQLGGVPVVPVGQAAWTQLGGVPAVPGGQGGALETGAHARPFQIWSVGQHDPSGARRSTGQTLVIVFSSSRRGWHRSDGTIKEASAPSLPGLVFCGPVPGSVICAWLLTVQVCPSSGTMMAIQIGGAKAPGAR
jgi:hypothetical protein